jgi:uncharacterized protein YlbG (UPF0298 family)
MLVKNCFCLVNEKNFTQVKNLEIPTASLVVYLKKFGQVKVFRRSFKNVRVASRRETHRYYIIFVDDKDALLLISMAKLLVPQLVRQLRLPWGEAISEPVRMRRDWLI